LLKRFLAKKANKITSFIPPPPRFPDEPSRKIMLVHCHPSEASFGEKLYQTTVDALIGSGNAVRAFPLYQINFDPVLSKQAWEKYGRSEINDIDIQEHIDSLRWADSLVFVYPTWWYSPPAMLKGWFDRVFIPDVAFRLNKSNQKIDNPLGLIPLLQNIKKIGVLTTYGASMYTTRYVGDPGRKMFTKGFRPLFHPDCELLWVSFYSADRMTIEDKEKAIARVKECFEYF